MCHDHTSTAIPPTSDSVESFTVGNFFCEQCNVGFPEVCDDFAAGEAADWDDHFGGIDSVVSDSSVE